MNEGVCGFCGETKGNVKAHERFCSKNPDNIRVAKTEKVAVAAAVSGERQPGTIISDHQGRKLGKVPWTMKEIERRFSLVEYTPVETLPVTWNGVSIQCFRGVSQLMPSCFRDILLDRARRMNKSHDTIPTPYGDIKLGAMGGLPPEP